MPFRYNPTGGAAALYHLSRFTKNNHNNIPSIIVHQNHHHHHRLFTTSLRLRNDDVSTQRDHYETLGVHPNATPAEIKKSYFRLSKLHHPDLSSSSSSNDASSKSNKFHLISESYAVLSHPSSRAAYDRTRPARFHHNPQHPAGGRPPSGLSRRRSSFQGPPPSFYRSGGWGSHSSKRRQAHESSTAQPGSPEGTTTADAQKHYYSKEKPGMGFGQGFQETFHQTSGMPHFDSVAHERTHRRHEQRRAQRLAERMGLNEYHTSGGSTAWITSFVAVSGCLLAAIAGGLMLGGIGGGEKNERERRAQVGGGGK